LLAKEWFQPETAKAHRQKCVSDHPDAYEEGVDHVRCPECQAPMLRLGRHLRVEHGWGDDSGPVEVKEKPSCGNDGTSWHRLDAAYNGVELMTAACVEEAWKRRES